MMAPVSPGCLGVCLPRSTVDPWYRTDFSHRPLHPGLVALGDVMLLVLRSIKKAACPFNRISGVGEMQFKPLT